VGWKIKAARVELNERFYEFSFTDGGIFADLRRVSAGIPLGPLGGGNGRMGMDFWHLYELVWRRQRRRRNLFS
jgi:hypothetical protein